MLLLFSIWARGYGDYSARQARCEARNLEVNSGPSGKPGLMSGKKRYIWMEFPSREQGTGP